MRGLIECCQHCGGPAVALLHGIAYCNTVEKGAMALYDAYPVLRDDFTIDFFYAVAAKVLTATKGT